MEEEPQYPRERLPGREHIPLYPTNFIVCRVIQLVLALAATGLTAYGVKSLVYAADCIMLFTAGAASISCIYFIVSERWAPSIYNYWAVLGLEIFLVVLWPVSFSLLGNQIAPYLDGYPVCQFYVGCYVQALSPAERAYMYCLGTTSIIAVVELLIFVISLAIHGTALHRHREAGLHCTPGSISPNTRRPIAVAAAAAAAATAAPQAVLVSMDEKVASVQPVPSDEPPLPSYSQVPANTPQEEHVPQPRPQDTGTPRTATQPTNGPAQPFNFSLPSSRPVSQKSVVSGRSAH